MPLEGGRDLVPIEDIVVANLGLLYPDRTIEEIALFRVTRLGDLELDDAALEICCRRSRRSSTSGR